MNRTITAAMAVVAITAGAGALWAQPGKLAASNREISGGSSQVTEGLKGVYVVVETPNAVGAEIGLRKSDMTTRVELALRRNGVRVLSQDEVARTLGRPYLYVNVALTSSAFSYQVSLKESMILERDPSVTIVGSATWVKGGAGTHGRDPEYIMRAVDGVVDRFCNDYLAANR